MSRSSPIRQTINALLKHFSKPIQTKINNITAKSQVTSAIPFTKKRNAIYGCLFIPYDIITKNNLELNQLQQSYKKHHVTIGLTWKNYKQLKYKYSLGVSNQLDEYLFTNIGGNDIVSSIIYIMKQEGNSGSGEQRNDLQELIKEIAVNGWTPVTSLVPLGTRNMINEKWGGHYYYNISGGQQNALQSWEGKAPLIFTTYKNSAANKDIADYVTATMLWQMIHIEDIDSCIKEDKKKIFKEQKIKLEMFLKNKKFMGKTCMELIDEIIWKQDNTLWGPIRKECLTIKNFDDSLGAEKHLIAQVSHNEATCKNKLYWDEDNQCILSDYRPGNLFWETKLGNMEQQDFTIEECNEDTVNKVIKRMEGIVKTGKEASPALKKLYKYFQNNKELFG